MADRYIVTKSWLTDVASAIRRKRNIAKPILSDEFASEIDSIEGKGKNKLAQLANKTITEVTTEDLAGATTIKNYMFSDCNQLASITIPETVTFIGTYAFCATGITTIKVPDTITWIDSNTFQNCSKLETVTLGNSLEKIYGSAFYGCPNLKDINIPQSVTLIESYAFYGCKALKNIILPDKITDINAALFNGCSSLTSLIIPEGVTRIFNNAFQRTGLTSITIPQNVTSMGNNVFYECNSLQYITMGGTTPPQITTQTFQKIPDTAWFYVPASVLEAYKTATNWSAYADRIFPITEE